MSKLSIIIPCFNVEKTIKETIKSINNQSFTDLEVIFVDGDSSDNTKNIIEKHCNFKYLLFSEKDNGIYDAMNKGLNFSNGKWVYFMGADDIFFNDYVLEEVSKNFDDYEFIYGRLRSNFYINKKIIDFENPKKLRKKFNNAPPFYHQSVFIRKKIIDELRGFNLNYKVHADFDLMVKAFQKSDRVIKTETIIADYNASGFSGIKFSTFKRNTKEFKTILKKNFALDIKWKARLLKNYFYLLFIIQKNFRKKIT